MAGRSLLPLPGRNWSRTALSCWTASPERPNGSSAGLWPGTSGRRSSLSQRGAPTEQPTAQACIGADITAANDRLADLDANVSEWQEILDLAASLATRCGDAYAKASDRTRKLFNAAVFQRLDVKGGRLSGEEYRPPFMTSSTCSGSHTKHEWRWGDSNPRPPACKAGALPLSYIPNWASLVASSADGSLPKVVASTCARTRDVM